MDQNYLDYADGLPPGDPEAVRPTPDESPERLNPFATAVMVGVQILGAVSAGLAWDLAGVDHLGRPWQFLICVVGGCLLTALGCALGQRLSRPAHESRIGSTPPAPDPIS